MGAPKFLESITFSWINNSVAAISNKLKVGTCTNSDLQDKPKTYDIELIVVISNISRHFFSTG